MRDGTGQPLQGASVTFTLGAAGSSSAGAASAAGCQLHRRRQPGNRDDERGRRRDLAAPDREHHRRHVHRDGDDDRDDDRRQGSCSTTAPDEPAAVSAGTAATESTTVGTRFPIRLAVTVTDKYGNPVARRHRPLLGSDAAEPVAASTARNAQSRTKTDAKGIAVAPPFVANRTEGGYVVRASVAGHSAAFALVNQPAGLAR